MISKPVPVFMYHTVGVKHNDWLWNYLTIDYQLFDRQMATLKSLGCNTVSLSELYDYMNNGALLPKNAFVLTFDDGYADNWVAAAPILKKYGFKGTVYVNPEFVEKSDKVRPTLEDVWSGKIAVDELQWKGFLSWAEMKEMEKQGVLEIQSHAMSHTWYFCEDEVVDFQHPGDEYIWMNWNQYPDKKYNYMSEDPEQYKNYGAPIYRYGKSLEIRRFFPDQKIGDSLVNYVNNNGGSDYFKKNSNWKNDLLKKYAELKGNGNKGRVESDEEYDKRINYELQESKNTLEKNLGKKIEFLCWPGGGYKPNTVEKALKIYKSVTLGSRDQTKKKNIPGDSPDTIKRIGAPYVTKTSQADSLDIEYLGGYYLYCHIRTFQGSKIYNYLRKILKALTILRVRLLG